MSTRFTYSRWDGTQKGFELDADSLLEAVTDDLLYHGDVNSALRRIMQQGMTDRNGERIAGLRDMLDKVRQRREEILDRSDLGGVYKEIADALDDIVDEERHQLDRNVAEADASGDERRADTARNAAAETHMELEMLPPDLAGKVRGLQNYNFESAEAQQRFDELMDKLREQLMQQFVDQMSGAMQNMSPQDMQRMKDMMAALNDMLDRHANGDDPRFDEFMSQYGDFFPENPQNIEELIELLAERMAQMQAMMNSMTPEQRAQLQQLSEQLLGDMDLQWQANRLGEHLQNMAPQAGWERRYQFNGDQPMGMGEAMQAMQELSGLEELENFMRNATNPGALAEADMDRVRELLGENAAQSLERLAQLTKMLEDEGLINQTEGRLELTPKGLRKIGQNALRDLFNKLAKDKIGQHQMRESGGGHERMYETKQYEYGDPFRLDLQQTLRNALRRQGGGTPVRLEPDDFEIERTEHVTTTSTVLMIDLSMSMPMRDNFLPAKKVAMALHALITSQYPRDYFGLVSFGRVAREVAPEKLPEMSWDFEWGTNMHHALALARRMLHRQSGTKQVIMVTDGEPTAHITPDGHAYFDYPPSPVTIEETLKEVMRCTREGIRINTFMLDDGWNLKTFVEQMCRINRGRAFYTTPDTLGDYVLVDFLEGRRANRRAS
jgi:uncharacterized protein with von Willebrand factor type A (vWA) domain